MAALSLALVAGILAITPSATAEEPASSSASVIGGTITDEGTGSPAAGVWVRAWCAYVEDEDTEYEYTYWDWCYTGDDAVETQTAADGSYQLAVPAGTYRIEVTSDHDAVDDDYVYGPWDRRFYIGGDSASAANDVVVGVDATVGGVDVTLTKRSSISGQVQGTDASPIGGASVTAYLHELEDYGNGDVDDYWYSFRSARTDSDGDYQLYLPQGEYKVRYTHAVWKTSFFSGASSLESAQALSLDADATMDGVDATLEPRPSIVGHVEGEGGSSISGVDVTAYKHYVGQDGQYSYDYWDGVYSATTNSNGDYQLYVDAGEWRVEFAHSDWKTEYFDNATSVGNAMTLTVADGIASTGIDAVLGKRGAVEGTVTNTDGQPLAEISVLAYKEHVEEEGGETYSYWQDWFTAYTDEQGRYRLPVDDGTWRLGFQDYSGNHANVYYNNAAVIGSGTDVVITSASTVTGIDAALAPAARINGTVTRYDGTAVRWANVDVYQLQPDGSWSNVRYVETSSTGAYSVGGLVAGTYRVRYVDYDTYPSQTRYFSGSSTLETATDIVLEAGETFAADEVFALGTAITGTVTNTDGTPLNGVQVNLYIQYASGQYTYWTQTASRTTSADGKYAFGNLTAGTPYRLQFSPHSTSNYLLEYYDNAATLETATTVYPSQDQAATADAVLAIGGSLTGTVTGENNQALGNVWVSAYRQVSEYSWSTQRTGTTNSSGAYTLTGLRAGTYRLQYQPQDGLHYASYYGGGLDLYSSATVTVTVGETATANQELHLAGSISGTITDAGGNPLSGVSAYASPVSSGSSRSASTNSAGLYTITGLAPGGHRVQFYPNSGSQYVGEYFDNVQSYNDATQVAVTAGETFTADASLGTAATISGTLTDSAGNAPSSGYVSAYNDSGSQVAGTSVQSNGHYSLKVLPGTYRLSFSGYSDGIYVTDYHVSATSLADATPVTVADGQSVTVNHQLWGTGTIAGTVTDSEGQPLADVKVLVGSGSAGNYRYERAVTNAEGNYSVKLAAGTYWLTFESPDGRYGDGTAGATEITTGSAATADSVLYIQYGRIVGTVVDQADMPLANVTVVAYNAGGSWIKSVTTNSSGQYTLGKLAAGTYKVLFDTTNEDFHTTEYFDNASTFNTATTSTIAVGDSVTADASLAAAGGVVAGTVTRPGTSSSSSAYGYAYLYRSAGNGQWSQYYSTSYWYNTNQSTVSYRFRHVEPGTYRLRVVPSDGTHVERYFPDSATIEGANDIEVTIGNVSTANVTTPVGASISGTLTGTDGSPAPGVYAYVYKVNPSTGAGSYWASGYTNSQGFYRVGSLPEGSYFVGFLSTNLHVGEYYNDVTTGAEAQRFDLAPGQSVTADAELDLQLANTTLPKIMGEIRVGEALTANPGTWTYSDATFTYQWRRNGGNISGATASTYTPVAADLNRQLSVYVTASRPNHNNASVVSAEVGPIDYGIITNLTPPATSGTARVGEQLHADPGTWKPSTVSKAYQWLRNGVAISGATGTSYTLVGEDLGNRIAVRVDATQTAYTPTSTTSAETGEVALGIIENLTRATIAGTPRAGETLNATPGTWHPGSVDVTYQWLRDGEPISGATESTYLLTTDDATHRVTVETTAMKVAYAPTSSTSTQTEKVTYGLIAHSVLPAITGTPQVGRQLSIDPGEWNTDGMSFAYTWYRDGDTTLSSNATYTPVAADIDHLISVELRGTKADWDPGGATTAHVGPVLIGQFDTTIAPAITGIPRVGDELQATGGTWEPTPTDTTYQWFSDGTPIADATTNNYTPVAGDVDALISVEVTVSRDGYESKVLTAEASATIALGVIASTQRPVISGTARVGEALTTTDGTWSPSTVDLAYQWQRNGDAIADATDSSYTLVPADADAVVTVVVTATKAGFAPTSRDSVATSPVTYDLVHNTSPPTVSGTAKVGETITATAGEWDQADVTVTWQWLRDGEPISGSTGQTRVINANDLGKHLSVRATGSKPNYDSGSADSEPTAEVVAGDLTNITPPAITGVVRVGEQLTAKAGGWSPDPTSYNYQWHRNGGTIDGATLSTYTLSDDDFGASISATVTANRDGYTAANATAAETAPVGPANHAPELTVDISPGTTGAAPFDIGLLFSASDEDGDALSYKVDYGDGSAAQTGSEPTLAPIDRTYAQPGNYLLKVSVTDGIRTISRTTTIAAVLPEPVSAIAGDDQVVVAGEPVHFDGSASRPVGMVSSYEWDFGDGTTGSEMSPSHTFNSPGDYTVILTASGAGESSTDEATVTVTPEPPFQGIVATVTGTSGGLLPDATVLVIKGDGSRITARTNTEGEARLRGLDDGEYTVFAVADGFQPGKAVATVDEGTAEVSIPLAAGPVATAEVDSRRMTPEEIEAVGIDPYDPANQNVVEFEIHLPFTSEDGTPPPVTGVANTDGFIGCPSIEGITVTCGSGWGGGWGGGGGGCACTGSFSTGGYTYEFWGTSEYLVWLVIPGRASWLKEFFDVALMVTNLSQGDEFVLTDGSAHFELPSGLTLAPTSFPQAATVDFPDIPAGEARTVHWYVRGDVEGEYPIKASYAGFLQPFDLPINITAEAKTPIKVWGGSAFKLAVQADKYVTAHYPHHVKVGIENVADVPMYNVTLELLSGGAQLNYIYQPREQLAHTKAVVEPGDKVEYDYILVPKITGTLVLDRAFVAYTTGLEFSSAEITENDVERERPDIKSVPLNRKVGLIFEDALGSSDHQVFSTPDEDTEFPKNPLDVTWVRDTADGRKRGFVTGVDPAEERYFAVSPVLGGKPEMSHPMVLARANSLTSSVTASASYTTVSGKPHSCGKDGDFPATISASDDFGLDWLEYEVSDANGVRFQHVVVPADADDTNFSHGITVVLAKGGTVTIRVRAKNLAGDTSAWTEAVTLDDSCPVHRAVVLAAGLNSSLDDNSSAVTDSDCDAEGDERDAWNKTWAANACDEQGSKGYGPGAAVQGSVLAQLEEKGYDPGQGRGAFFRDVLEFSYTGATAGIATDEDGQEGCRFIPQDYAAWNTYVELAEVGTRMNEAADEYYEKLVKYSNCWREKRGEILDFSFIGHSEGGYEALALAKVAALKARNDNDSDDVRVTGVLTIDGAVDGATILTQLALQDCVAPLVGIPREVIKASMAVNSVAVPTAGAIASRGQTLTLIAAEQLAAAADISLIRSNGTYVMNVTNAYDGCLKSQATISGAASDSHIYDVWGDGWSGMEAHGALNKHRAEPAGPHDGYPLFEVMDGVSPAPLPRIINQGPSTLGPDGRSPVGGSGTVASPSRLNLAAAAEAGGSMIRVRVTDEAGQSLPNVQVALVDDLGNIRDVVVSQQAGWVTLVAEPGEYSLVAAADGHLGGEQTLPLSPGANDDVSVALVEGAVVTSVLKDEAGIANANVLAALYDGNTLLGATATDVTGRAVFVVPAGTYGLRYFDPEGHDDLPDDALQVTPEVGNPSAGEITYQVGTPLPPEITSDAPPATATVGTAYSFQVTGTGNPTYSVQGSLPPGLSLSSEGVLNGNPTTAGTFEFKVRATNAGGQVLSPIYAIAVSGAGTSDVPPPEITSDAPPATATVGTAYLFQVTGTGNPTYSIQGPLPPGLSLSSEGVLNGNPTTAGTFEFKVRATNAGGQVLSPIYAITVSVAPGTSHVPLPEITSGAPPATGTVGTPYSFQVTGTGQPTYSVQGSLPPGLSLATSGLLSGTPTTAGTFDFKVRAANTGGYIDSSTYTVAVTAVAGAQPSNKFTPPKAGKANTTKGTLTLTITLPGAGTLQLGPDGKSRVKKKLVTATRAGPVKITLNLTKAGLRQLRDKLRLAKLRGGTIGKLTVKTLLTFTPTRGSANSKPAKYTLKLK